MLTNFQYHHGCPQDFTIILSVFQGEHLLIMVYEVPLSTHDLSILFATFDEMSDALGIEEYSVSQTTLDQVLVILIMDKIVKTQLLVNIL